MKKRFDYGQLVRKSGSESNIYRVLIYEPGNDKYLISQIKSIYNSYRYYNGWSKMWIKGSMLRPLF